MSSSFSRSRGTPTQGPTTTTLLAEQARRSRIDEKLDSLANMQLTESHGVKALQTDLQSIRDELSTLKQQVQQQGERNVSGGAFRARKLPSRLCVS